MELNHLGRYIVADPTVCHGKPTFRGTRILVSQVLEQVATGMDWKAIEAEWRGRVDSLTLSHWRLPRSMPRTSRTSS